MSYVKMLKYAFLFCHQKFKLISLIKTLLSAREIGFLHDNFSRKRNNDKIAINEFDT